MLFSWFFSVCLGVLLLLLLPLLIDSFSQTGGREKELETKLSFVNPFQEPSMGGDKAMVFMVMKPW